MNSDPDGTSADAPASLPTYMVEDNPLVLQGVSEALEELGSVRVIGHAPSAPEAIDWLAHHPEAWRLLIVDMFLQQGSGLDVLHACRDRATCQHVVVLTNYATPEVRHRSLSLGADEVFDKSTEIDELIAYCCALEAA